jgi:hypothetical protein
MNRVRWEGGLPFYIASPWLHKNGRWFRRYMRLVHWVGTWYPRRWTWLYMRLTSNRFIRWQFN